MGLLRTFARGLGSAAKLGLKFTGPAGALAGAAADSIKIRRNVMTTPFTRHEQTEETAFFDNRPPGAQQPGMAMVRAGTCPVGFRLNKTTYITRGGGTSHWPHQLLVHPKGTVCVKRRRMNVGNARALRRALRRAKGFLKLARRAHAAVGGFRHRRSIGPGRRQLALPPAKEVLIG